MGKPRLQSVKRRNESVDILAPDPVFFLISKLYPCSLRVGTEELTALSWPPVGLVFWKIRLFALKVLALGRIILEVGQRAETPKHRAGGPRMRAGETRGLWQVVEPRATLRSEFVLL